MICRPKALLLAILAIATTVLVTRALAPPRSLLWPTDTTTRFARPLGVPGQPSGPRIGSPARYVDP